MVRSRARIAESDAPAESREKLRAALDEYVPDEAERQWIEPRLMTLLGLSDDAGGDRGDAGELFAAWRTFFERISAKGTVVLVFEDLQWADSGLFEFLAHLIQWSRAHPIMVVTLARPELLDRRTDWGGGQRNFTGIHLEPLGPERCARCSTASCLACPSLRSRRSWPGPRGSRSMPSRRSGCW